MDNNIEEILSKFGNADYSDEFWKRVNTRLKEEQALDELYNQPVDLVKFKTKVYGTLKGDL